MSSEINNLYEFGKFRFDGNSRRLWQGGEPILLSPKAAELLSLLLERRGEFVSKEEIFERVWAETFVEDGVLTQNVYTLRKALGKDADGQPLIENRTRLGYRIAVPVKLVLPAVQPAETPGKTNLVGQSAPENAVPQAAPPKARGWKIPAAVLVFAALLLVGAGAFLGYRFWRPAAQRIVKPLETVRYEALTDTGDIAHPVLSPDGNMFAYVSGNKVYLKDIASKKALPLEIPDVVSFSSLRFSANGNFLYFRNNRILRTAANVLMVSRFGGESRLLAENVWGEAGLSPDGRRIAFFRVFPQEQIYKLLVKNLESGEEHELGAKRFPDQYSYNCAPAWSPDGAKLALITENYTNQTKQLKIIDAAGGAEEELKPASLRQFRQVVWFPDGKNLVVSASDGGVYSHVWKISYPAGEIVKLTTGLNDYGKVSVSGDGKKILTLQTTQFSNIFVADAPDVDRQKQVTFGTTNNDGQSALDWFGEEKIVFVSDSDQNPMSNISIVDADGNARRSLTSFREFSADFPTSDGRFIYFTTNRNRVINISRMDAGGGSLAQITEGGDGLRNIPQISADGEWLYFIHRTKDGAKIKRLRLADRTEETLIEKAELNPASLLSLSADGRFLAFYNWINKGGDGGADEEKAAYQFGVFPTANPNDVKLFDVPAFKRIIRLVPAAEAFDYISTADNESRILRQDFAGGAPKTVLTLPKDLIFNFAWSRSGSRLALARGKNLRDAVLLTNFD